jgi:transcriptional regulator GlxA family with amidase domain
MARWLASVIGVDRVEHDRLPDDALVANAQLWIEQHFTEDFRIGDLARTLSTSHQTLIRRFTRAIGMRPREYAQHLRIQAAQRMLRQTHRRIELIATLVGYADARSFREIFRERTGMSASAYRASARTA